jgi:hypothetical protein
MNFIQQTAAALAADLAGARVDPNEAQKALAYLRSKRDDQNFDDKQFFAYLRSIVQGGRVVIRSNQTLSYYRELLAACERHLRGMGKAEMAQTLGWAIRLLRYYRVVPDAMDEVVAQPAPTRSTHAAPSQPVAPPKLAAARPAAPQLPDVGAIFTAKVLEVEERAVFVQVPGFDETKVVGVIKAEVLGGRSYRRDNAARVEVSGVRELKNGTTVVELKPAPKKDGK